MPAECSNDRCHFFLWDNAGPCPACGQDPSRPWPKTRLDVLWLSAAATALVVVMAVIVIIGGVTRLVGSALVFVAVLLAVWTAHRRRSRPVGWTIDARYHAAVEKSANWLGIWSDLYGLGAGDTVRDADEQQLLDEALDMVVAAENAASAERAEYASAYVANALGRLRFLTEPHETRDVTEWRAAWRPALAAAEHYLETLWLDHGFARHARAEVDTLRALARRIELAHTIDAISFVGAGHHWDAPMAMSGNEHLWPPDSTAPDPIDLQRQRLRIERDLFLD